MKLITNVGVLEINNLNDLPSQHNNPFLPNELEVISVLVQWFRNQDLTISTSGSTGLPTEITLLEALLRWSVQQTTKALSLQNEKVFLALSASKVGGAMMVLRSVINHWDLLISEPIGNPMLKLSETHDFTFTSLVPYQLAQIFEDAESLKKLFRFNKVLIGGGAIPESLENEIRKSTKHGQTRFFHSYGMTETASHIALREINENADTSRFTAFDDVRLTNTEVGGAEILISEIGLKITTNDVLEINGQQFRYIGRLDDVVNSGGVKIQLHEVTLKLEKEMNTMGLKNQFFFWKKPDDQWGEALVLVVEGHEIPPQLLNLINQTLKPVQQPKSLFLSESFNLTESGKIDRIKTFQKSIEVGSKLKP